MRNLIFLIFCTIASFGQTPATPHVTPPAPPQTLADYGTHVSILGYHDFSETEKETEMRIRTSKFRQQLQTLKDQGITVISMPDFIEWKSGRKSLPPKCVLIGIDDGWLSTYTDAFPILREFGYPFTLYLYKNYVDVGGKSMSSAMVREMMKYGATIGSHSTSHPFPKNYRMRKSKGPQVLDAFLRIEMGESKRFLEKTFHTKITTYAYPGGYVMDEMLPLADEFGYTHLFTVLPGKVTRETPDKTIPRYMILGTHDQIFQTAIHFNAAASANGTPGNPAAPQPPKLAVPVSPQPGAIINSRLPEISVDLSALSDVDPATLAMHVSGFGRVPANHASETGKYSWQVNRRLRQPACSVTVSWKTTAGELAPPVTWDFQIDRTAAYLPETPAAVTPPPAAE
ncbi:MAG: polysaccharide deacetylase family protein [Verrucomicrobiota bacterium]